MRGCVLGAACLLLTMAAHGAAGGTILEPALIPGLAVAVTLGTVWAGRRATTARLAVFVIAVQALLHVMSVAGGHGHGSSVIPSPAMVIAHGVAAVAMAVVLTHADAIAHAWHAFLTALARPLPALIPVPIAAPIVPAPRHRPVPLLPLVSRDISRRGPPNHE